MLVTVLALMVTWETAFGKCRDDKANNSNTIWLFDGQSSPHKFISALFNAYGDDERAKPFQLWWCLNRENNNNDAALPMRTAVHHKDDTSRFEKVLTDETIRTLDEVGIWIGLRPSKATLESCKLLYVFGNTYNEHSTYDLKTAKDMLKHPSFKQCRPTVFYFHGFIEKAYDESVSVVVDAYLKRNDHNMVVVDWSELADGSYIFDAVPNHKRLGEAMADTLLEMFSEGLNVEKFHLVGHSLGGQLAGYIGRTILARTKGGVKIKRISALDPAFPGFYPGILGTHLSPADATFVDVIHTDAWLYGAPATTGTVDFWPNGGKTLQPGAPKRNYIPLTDNDLTSHRRSWWFWAESVSNRGERTFDSVKCKSWKDFKAGRCDPKAPVAYMGIDSELGISGDYYLQTNGAIPFSRGEEGIKYHPED